MLISMSLRPCRATHALPQDPLRLHSSEPAQRHALCWSDKRLAKPNVRPPAKPLSGVHVKVWLKHLVYYEMLATMEDAIRRETQVKKWRRIWKLRIIEEMNPSWDDPFDEATGEIKDGPADVARKT